jgi:hypothetical protein
MCTMSMTNPLVLSVLTQASFNDGGCITQKMSKVSLLDAADQALHLASYPRKVSQGL